MSKSDNQAPAPLRILCWNVNALPGVVDNAKLRHGSWRGFFEAHNIDIFCLQETKLCEEKLTKEQCCVDGFQSFWACSKVQGRLGAAGVATYCANAWAPVSCEVDSLSEHDADAAGGQLPLDGEGRIVVTDHGAFVLVNVYVPNAGDAAKKRPRLDFKMRWLRTLAARCDTLAAAGREVLILGDFNVGYLPGDVHARFGLENSYSEEERGFMAALTQRYTDVWSRLHPDTTGVYTVWNEKTSARAFNEGLRIDFVLATPGLVPMVDVCEVLGADALPPKWSDHAGILVEISGVPPPPPHAPCAAWLRLNRRFNDPSQRSLLSMFGKKTQGTKRAEGKSGEGAEAKRRCGPDPAAAAAAAARAGGGKREAVGSTQRHEKPGGGGRPAAKPAGKGIASFFDAK